MAAEAKAACCGGHDARAGHGHHQHQPAAKAGVLDPASDDPRIVGTRALFDAVAGEPRLTATALQTVGAKPWDGFLIALVTD